MLLLLSLRSLASPHALPHLIIASLSSTPAAVSMAPSTSPPQTLSNVSDGLQSSQSKLAWSLIKDV